MVFASLDTTWLGCSLPSRGWRWRIAEREPTETYSRGLINR
jgi:hypothetical protein